MARLETQGYLKSRVDGNTVGYSVPLSSDTIRANHKLKDEYFISYSSAPYARKTARIYQFGYGINAHTAVFVDREQLSNTIQINNNCARFIPVCNPNAPEESTPSTVYPAIMAQSHRYKYTQDGIAIQNRIFKDYRSNYMYGDDLTARARGVQILHLLQNGTSNNGQSCLC